MAKTKRLNDKMPEWFGIANKETIFSTAEVLKILGIDRHLLRDLIVAKVMPPPDTEQTISNKPNFAPRQYWKKRTVLDFLIQCRQPDGTFLVERP